MAYRVIGMEFEPDVIAATQELIQAGLWDTDMNHTDKATIIERWIEKCSSLYEMVAPAFYLQPDPWLEQQTNGGLYYSNEHAIVLHSTSLTTLLNKFRCALQSKKSLTLFRNDLEEDAIAWSLNLFKASCLSYKETGPTECFY